MDSRKEKKVKVKRKRRQSEQKGRGKEQSVDSTGPSEQESSTAVDKFPRQSLAASKDQDAIESTPKPHTPTRIILAGYDNFMGMRVLEARTSITVKQAPGHVIPDDNSRPEPLHLFEPKPNGWDTWSSVEEDKPLPVSRLVHAASREYQGGLEVGSEFNPAELSGKIRKSKATVRSNIVRSDAANTMYSEADEDGCNIFVSMTDDLLGTEKTFGDYWIADEPLLDDNSAEDYVLRLPDGFRMPTAKLGSKSGMILDFKILKDFRPAETQQSHLAETSTGVDYVVVNSAEQNSFVYSEENRSPIVSKQYYDKQTSLHQDFTLMGRTQKGQKKVTRHKPRKYEHQFPGYIVAEMLTHGVVDNIGMHTIVDSSTLAKVAKLSEHDSKGRIQKDQHRRVSEELSYAGEATTDPKKLKQGRRVSIMEDENLELEFVKGSTVTALAGKKGKRRGSALDGAELSTPTTIQSQRKNKDSEKKSKLNQLEMAVHEQGKDVNSSKNKRRRKSRDSTINDLEMAAVEANKKICEQILARSMTVNELEQYLSDTYNQSIADSIISDLSGTVDIGGEINPTQRFYIVEQDGKRYIMSESDWDEPSSISEETPYENYVYTSQENVGRLGWYNKSPVWVMEEGGKQYVMHPYVPQLTGATADADYDYVELPAKKGKKKRGSYKDVYEPGKVVSSRKDKMRRKSRDSTINDLEMAALEANKKICEQILTRSMTMNELEQYLLDTYNQSIADSIISDLSGAVNIGGEINPTQRFYIVEQDGKRHVMSESDWDEPSSISEETPYENYVYTSQENVGRLGWYNESPVWVMEEGGKRYVMHPYVPQLTGATADAVSDSVEPDLPGHQRQVDKKRRKKRDKKKKIDDGDAEDEDYYPVMVSLKSTSEKTVGESAGRARLII